jgi:hypothetical protein
MAARAPPSPAPPLGSSSLNAADGLRNLLAAFELVRGAQALDDAREFGG